MADVSEVVQESSVDDNHAPLSPEGKPALVSSYPAAAFPPFPPTDQQREHNNDDGGTQTSTSDLARRSKRQRKVPDRLKDCAVDVAGGEDVEVDEEDSPLRLPKALRVAGHHRNIGSLNKLATQQHAHACDASDIARQTEHLEDVLKVLIHRHTACSAKLQEVWQEHQALSAALRTVATQLPGLQPSYSMGSARERFAGHGNGSLMQPMHGGAAAPFAPPNHHAASWHSAQTRHAGARRPLQDYLYDAPGPMAHGRHPADDLGPMPPFNVFRD